MFPFYISRKMFSCLRHTMMSEDATPSPSGFWHDVFNPCESRFTSQAHDDWEHFSASCALVLHAEFTSEANPSCRKLSKQISYLMLSCRLPGVHRCNGAATDCRTFWRKSRTAYMNEVSTSCPRGLHSYTLPFLTPSSTSVCGTQQMWQ